jgi:hypothetical protein
MKHQATESQKDIPPPKADKTEQPVSSQAFKLEALGISEDEFPSYFSKYLEKVDKRILLSFNECDTLIAKQTNGYERHYLKLT